jgi:hypothetical protein
MHITTSQNVRRGLVIGAVLMTGFGVSAQQTRNESLTAEAQVQQRRLQFQLMEGVLKNAVRQGAREIAMRAQNTLPVGALFMGEAKAKGFPLDGYGIVFDIEIPIIRESAVIASRLMTPPMPPPAGTQPVSGRGAAGNATTRSTAVVAEDPMARSPIVPDPFMADPNQFYRNTVRDRIVDAMLDYSRSLNVPATESLSVVARSEEDGSLYDDSRTLILRIKGEDLALFHDGKITRDEIKKRIVESQF